MNKIPSILTLQTVDIEPWDNTLTHIFIDNDQTVTTSTGVISDWGTRNTWFRIDLKEALGANYQQGATYLMTLDDMITVPYTNSNVNTFKPLNNEHFPEYRALAVYMHSNAWDWVTGAFDIRTNSNKQYAQIGIISGQKRVGQQAQQDPISSWRRDEWLNDNSITADGVIVRITRPHAHISMWLDASSSAAEDIMVRQRASGDVFDDIDCVMPYWVARLRFTKISE